MNRIIILSACTVGVLGCMGGDSSSTEAGGSASTSTELGWKKPVFNPVEKTLPEIQHALINKHITSEALVNTYLARIAAYDDSLHAIRSLNDQAVDDALASDAAREGASAHSDLFG